MVRLGACLPRSDDAAYRGRQAGQLLSNNGDA